MKSLEDSGINTMIHYPYPVHMQRAFKQSSQVRLSVTEKSCKEVISLPIYPELSIKNVDEVSDAIIKFLDT